MLRGIISKFNYVATIQVNGSVYNTLDRIGLDFMSNDILYPSFQIYKIHKLFKKQHFDIKNNPFFTFFEKEGEKTEKVRKHEMGLCKINASANKATYYVNWSIFLVNKSIWNSFYITNIVLRLDKHSIEGIFFNI